MIEEPYITINGHDLTEGQAVTIRVAIETLASNLADIGLGSDEHGTVVAKNYLAKISEIRN